MKVYYLTSCTHGLLNLALKRIKVSTFGDLNDPFEVMAVNVRNRQLRSRIISLKDELAAVEGILCFSTSWSSTVMWAHYGDKHRGMALGFEVPEETLRKVTYTSELLRFSGSTDSSLRSQFTNCLRTTKCSAWSYEKEVRMFVELAKCESEDGHYFKKFDDDLTLAEVVVGERSGVSVQRVKEIISGYASYIHVRKARSAFTKYGVIENLLCRTR